MPHEEDTLKIVISDHSSWQQPWELALINYILKHDSLAITENTRVVIAHVATVLASIDGPGYRRYYLRTIATDKLVATKLCPELIQRIIDTTIVKQEDK